MIGLSFLLKNGCGCLHASALLCRKLCRTLLMDQSASSAAGVASWPPWQRVTLSSPNKL